jgi:hypothetical protein
MKTNNIQYISKDGKYWNDWVSMKQHNDWLESRWYQKIQKVS